MAFTNTAALLCALLCLFALVQAQSCNTSGQRNDCGYVGIDQQQCEAKGCCWDALNPNPGNLPWCFYSNGLIEGYELSSFNKSSTGGSGTLKLLDGGNPQYGADIDTLALEVDTLSNTAMRVVITDASSSRWEVPEWVVPRPKAAVASAPQYAFSYQSSPFGFAVTRTTDNVVMFNSSIPADQSFNGLQFKDQYLSLSTQIPSSCSIFGLGESTQSAGLVLQRNGNVYTMWARDTPSLATNQNLYGSHPLYIQLNEDGSAHGVLLLNSNGMDVTLTQQAVNYQVIGGVFEFYFFVGPTPDLVVQQYIETVAGLPHFQAYWSLGFHQSAYGMPSIAYVEEVVANYTAAAIPLDTIWSDIDYMDAFKDFTFDPSQYPVDEVASFCEELHENQQQYVPIVDPGIKVESGYSSYTDLLMSNAFIYDVNKDPFQGQVWPGYTIFPDFLNSAAHTYWTNEIAAFLDQVPFDGLWIDMNEISNFCNGECKGGSPIPLGSTQCGCSQSSFSELLSEGRQRAVREAEAGATNPTNPPYAINNGGSRDPLNIKTLDMDSTHAGGVLEYDAHNLYGITEAIATTAALESYYSNRRSFVLSRSTFVGSGAHTSHWTGDNQSVWADMWYSVVGMLNFNMFGIPMVGADICGFNGDTTEEMCTRWIEVGAFSPFCRNHNAIGQVPQELYRWETTAAVGRQVLLLRYSLLPLLYTRTWKANATGDAILRPLWFQFPQDANTHAIDRQFLVGDALLVSPVLDQGATSVQAYFPPSTPFYSLYSFELQKSGSVSLDAPLEFIPVHLVGGSVLVQHSQPAMTSAASRASPFNMTVALNTTGTAVAAGEVYVDDGSSYDYQKGQYTHMAFSANATAVVGTATHSGFAGTASISTSLSDVAVIGVSKAPKTVSVNGASTSSFSFDKNTSTLRVSSLSLDVNKSFSITWSS